MKRLIGIDFGTSSTQVTYRDLAGNPTLLRVGPDDNPYNIPSLVEVVQGGQNRYGFDAEAIIGPNTITSIKSRIPSLAAGENGSDSDDFKLIAEYLNYVGGLTRAADPNLDPFSPQVQVQMSCPTNWKLKDRNLLLEAAKRAGFKVKDLELIDEPISATVAWLAETSSDVTPGKALIFDMGAGTLDLAVVAVDEAGFGSIIGARGTRLAGDAFDQALFKVLAPRIEEQLSKKIGELSSYEISSLTRGIRVAKEELSNNEELATVVTVPGLVGRDNKSFSVALRREDFDQALITPLGEQTGINVASTEAIGYVLKHSMMFDGENSSLTVEEISRIPFDYLASEVNHVVLVGGMTKVPSIRNFLTTLFPNAEISYATRDPQTGEDAPRLTVSLGLVRESDPMSLSTFRPNFSIKFFWEKEPEGLMIYEAYSDVFDLGKEKYLSNRSFGMPAWPSNNDVLDNPLPTSSSTYKGGIVALVKPNGTLIDLEVEPGVSHTGLFFAFGQKCAQGAGVRFTSDGEIHMNDGIGRATTITIRSWIVSKRNGRLSIPVKGSGLDTIPEDLEVWWSSLLNPGSLEAEEDLFDDVLDGEISADDPDLADIQADDEDTDAQPSVGEVVTVSPDVESPQGSTTATEGLFKPARSGSIWSLEEDLVLVSGYKNGVTFEAIAEDLSRSTGAVLARVAVLCSANSNAKLPYNFKVTIPALETNQELMLRTSLQAGVPLDIAASALSVSIEDVFSFGIHNRLVEPIDPHELHRSSPASEDASRKGAPWTTKEVEQLKIEISLGMTLADTARAHGRTIWAILIKTRQLGGLNDGQLEKLFGEAYFD